MFMTEGAAAIALALAMLVNAPVEAKRDLVAGAATIADPAPAGRWEALQLKAGSMQGAAPESDAAPHAAVATPAAWRVRAHGLCRTASHAASPLCAAPE
jgi:hypothetical protein